MKNLHEMIGSIDEQLQMAEVSSVAPTTDFFSVPHEQMVKYVLVQIGEGDIAIPIADLAEIGQMPTITDLPNLPPWIRGIVNLRGEIVSIIDLNMFLAPDDTKKSGTDKMVVLTDGEMKIGICIDQVKGNIARSLTDHFEAEDTSLSEAAPDVFRQMLKMQGEAYHILKTRALLSKNELLNYYTP